MLLLLSYLSIVEGTEKCFDHPIRFGKEGVIAMVMLHQLPLEPTEAG